jgi:hypothetical protein
MEPVAASFANPRAPPQRKINPSKKAWISLDWENHTADFDYWQDNAAYGTSHQDLAPLTRGIPSFLAASQRAFRRYVARK